jgi:hypothetical protein
VVTTADDIRSDYELSVGSLVVDLSDVQDLDEMISLDASIGVGELLIRSEGAQGREQDRCGREPPFDRSTRCRNLRKPTKPLASEATSFDITVEPSWEPWR